MIQIARTTRVPHAVAFSQRRGSSGRPLWLPPAAALLQQGARLVGQALVLASVATVPWFFGGVLPAVRVWLFASLGAAVACTAVEVFFAGPRRAQIPWAVVPLLGALGLGAVQLAPVSPALLRILAPEGAALRAAMDGPDDQQPSGHAAQPAVKPATEARPISLYPRSTRDDLAMFLLATGAFCCGAILFRTSSARMWLCTVLAANGAAIAFFGLAQALQWNGRLYWYYPLTEGGAPFGPFVCRNNAAGFLCLTLAAAVGMLFWTLRRNTRSCEGPARGWPGPRTDAWTLRHPPAPRWGRSRAVALGRSVRQVVARLDGANLAALAAGACIVAGILCSLSRGGWLAMAGATAGTLVAVAAVRRRASWMWPVVPIAVLGVGLVAWTGMVERVQTRMATLSDWDTLSQNRLPHWKDSLQAVPDFWRAGSGLGTYRYVYKPYQTRHDSSLYYHAENQYLEALVEGGLLGLGLLLAAIALVMGSAYRLLRARPNTRTFAFGLVGVFAVLSQALHGFFDFGLYLPANMLTLALLGGAVCGSTSSRHPAQPAPRRGRLGRPGTGAAIRAGALTALWVGLLAGLAWGGLQSQGFAAREAALAHRPEPDPHHAAESAARLDAAIARLDDALRTRDDDAKLHLAAARLRVARYRVASLQALQQSLLRKAPPQQLWEMTAPDRHRVRAAHLAAGGFEAELAALRQHPLVRQYLVPARQHLLRARRACPLAAVVHLALAELAYLAEPAGQETLHVRRACRLAPGDAALWFAAGRFELQAGRRDSAWSLWRESLMRGPQKLDSILALARRDADALAIARHLLPDSPQILLDFARRECAAPEHDAARAVLGRRLESLLPSARFDPAETAYLAGMARAMQGDRPGALGHLRHAVQQRPAHGPWRHELAGQLFDAGRLDESHREARTAVHLDPATAAYRQMLQRIHRARLGRPEADTDRVPEIP